MYIFIYTLFLGLFLRLSFDSSMAAPPARARADYDYLIKLLLIGDSGTSLLCFVTIDRLCRILKLIN